MVYVIPWEVLFVFVDLRCKRVLGVELLRYCGKDSIVCVYINGSTGIC